MWVKFDEKDSSSFPKCSGTYEITYKEMMIAHPAIRGTDLDLFGKHLVTYCRWDNEKQQWATALSAILGPVLAYNPVKLELNDKPWQGDEEDEEVV